MNGDVESILAPLVLWTLTLNVVIDRLTSADGDAHEALSISMVQALHLFGGPKSTVTQQLFPVLDSIKAKLDDSDHDGALHAANRLREQLDEVKALVRAGMKPTGNEVHPPAAPPNTSAP